MDVVLGVQYINRVNCVLHGKNRGINVAGILNATPQLFLAVIRSPHVSSLFIAVPGKTKLSENLIPQTTFPSQGPFGQEKIHSSVALATTETGDHCVFLCYHPGLHLSFRF